MDYGYLQHGTPPAPMCTERVRVKHEAPDIWHAWYEGRWRLVHVQLRRLYIVHRGERITLLIEGV